MPTYAIEAIDVYPETIGAVEYGYGAKVIRFKNNY